jgi:Papain family cysteine protease
MFCDEIGRRHSVDGSRAAAASARCGRPSRVVFAILGLLASTSAGWADGFDWTTKGIATPVCNQGNTNNCWAIASTAAFEANRMIRFGQPAELSPQPVLDRLQQDGPYFPAAGLKDLVDNGTTTRDVYPYTGQIGPVKNVSMPFKASTWSFVAEGGGRPSAAQLKEALVQHGPLVVAVYASSDFQQYRGGVFRESLALAPNDANHAILLVGWDTSRGWKLKNSWGENWGEQGYMWIDFDSNNVGANAAWVESIGSKVPKKLHQFLAPANRSTLLPIVPPAHTQGTSAKQPAAKTPAHAKVEAAKPAIHAVKPAQHEKSIAKTEPHHAPAVKAKVAPTTHAPAKTPIHPAHATVPPRPSVHPAAPAVHPHPPAVRPATPAVRPQTVHVRPAAPAHPAPHPAPGRR